jgi:hypothetical protein
VKKAILMLTMVTLMTLATMVSANFPTVKAQPVFEDGFETANLSQWNGVRLSSGEAVRVSSYQSCIGAYSARATSNGGGGVEYAYIYKTISASTLYVYATFYVSRSGIAENNDNFYLMAFQAGSTSIATVGWRKVDGVVKWFLLARNGANSEIAYSDQALSLNKYYSIQLYWTKDALTGEAVAEIGDTTWAGTYWGTPLSISGINTADYGDLTEVRVGLPRVLYCRSTTVYFDCVKMSNDHIDDLYPLGWGQEVFADGFESGDHDAWSQTTTRNSGGAMVVSSSKLSGLYGARFTSGTRTTLWGQAYCSKNINLPFYGFTEYSFSAAFNVASLNLPRSNGRIYLFRAWSGNVEVISAGIDKTNGVTRWFVSRKDGAVTGTVYSNVAPVLNKWFTFEITWKPWEFSWGTCGCDMTITYVDGSSTVYIDASTTNPLVYPTFNKVDIGLAKTSNCRAAVVYADDFSVDTTELE